MAAWWLRDHSAASGVEQDGAGRCRKLGSYRTVASIIDRQLS
jgi:hypothetical protein